MTTLHEAAPEPVAEVFDTFGNSQDPNKAVGHVWLKAHYFPPIGTKLYAAPPAAPAPVQPVVREPLPEPVQRLLRFAGKKRSEVSNPCLTAREAIVIADWMQAHGITGGSNE